MAPISPAAVGLYVDAFQRFPDLKTNGFSFLIDASGKLFTKAKPSLKDVEVNIEARNRALVNGSLSFCDMFEFCDSVLGQAIHAVMLATKGRGRFSSHLLKACILTYFENEKLFPKGIVKEMECVQAWSLKMGRGLQRLVS